jgi:3-phytase
VFITQQRRTLGKRFHILFALLLSSCQSAADKPVPEVRPYLATDQVSEDPDDPAVWISAGDPARSLLICTNKTPAPGGALVVFGIDGKTRQTIAGLDRPNNVDVEYGLPLGGTPVDIAVVTERLQRRLRVFRIAPDGSGITDVSSGGGIPVFEGQDGENGAPMGVALYRRPSDTAIFAVVGRKTGPSTGYLWQYRLEDDGNGTVKGTKVREFGNYSGGSEIEAIAVDDVLGYVYYADEGDGIHKWYADPDHPQAGTELAHFGREGFQSDREGIAIYSLADGTGYILCTDQIEGNSQYRIFRREGAPGNPHDHSELLKVVRGGADSTDGLEVVSATAGTAFPDGLMIAMNSRGKNFLVYRWQDVAASGEPKLKSSSTASP